MEASRYMYKEKCTNELKKIANLQDKGVEEMQYKNIKIKRKPGSKIWWARFMINGIKYVVYGKTQIECYNNLKQKLHSLNIYTLTTKHKYTLKEWYDYFMKNYKIDNKAVKDTTIIDDNNVFKNFENYYNCQINDFNEVTILSMINNCNGERQKQKAYILLHSIFKKAVDNDIIKKDPMINLKKPSYEAPEQNFFTLQEQLQFLKVAKEFNSINADFLSICLLQGFTRGECWGLSNEKVDFLNNTITINECIKEQTNNTTTKNQYRVRIVPLFDESKKILLKYKSSVGRYFDIKPHKLYEDFKKICEKANVKKITIHELRHTFITRCQEKKIPLFVIQSWVGHRKGSKVTTSVYTHISSELNEKYIDVMNSN